MTKPSIHKTRGPSPAADESTHRADDLLGAVVPLRAREAPETSDRNDLSNVIPFHPRQRAAEGKTDKSAPAVVCDQDTRPCPFLAAFDWRKQWPLLIAGSLIVHTSLFAWFMQEPPPQASIGLEVISVELVLGAQSEAGTAQTPGQVAIESAYSPDIAPPDDTRTELTEQPIHEAETKPTPEPQQEPNPVVDEVKPQIMAAAPPEPLPEPEVGGDPEPQKEPVVQAVKETPKPVAKKPVKEKGKSKSQRIAAASDPSVAANSIGRGRSDNDRNYRGLVVAHLSRYKQFPADARDGGIASVSFSISGSGSVTSVRLARSSGSAAIDREVQAMVRRASPFPPPPSRQTASFTAPVAFERR